MHSVQRIEVIFKAKFQVPRGRGLKKKLENLKTTGTQKYRYVLKNQRFRQSGCWVQQFVVRSLHPIGATSKVAEVIE